MRKGRILHVLFSGDLAGAEHITENNIKNLDGEKYQVEACFLSTRGVIGDRLSAFGTKCYSLSMKTGFSLVGAMRFLFLVAKQKYDLIHFNSPNLITLMIATFFAPNIIYHIHGTGKMGGVRKFFFGKCFRKVKKFIAVSESTKQNFVDCFDISENRIVIIYNSISLDAFKLNFDKKEFIESLDIPRNKLFIGMVGRFAEQKGHALLLESVKRLSCMYNDFHLLLLGDGELREQIEKEALRLNIKEYISFMGAQAEINRYFNIFDVLVVPSRWEPFGIVVIEAMASKVPVVAFAVGGIPEIIRDGVDGFLVPPEDTDLLAQKMLILLKDKDKRNKFAESAFLRAEMFDIGVNVKKLEAVYDELLGR